MGVAGMKVQRREVALDHQPEERHPVSRPLTQPMFTSNVSQARHVPHCPMCVNQY